MQEFIQIVILAFLVETMWEHSKLLWQEGKFQVDVAGALILSIVATVTFKKDIFHMCNFSEIPTIIGMVGTGTIISRGSNITHDIITKLTETLRE